jgi:hypothetical protein
MYSEQNEGRAPGGAHISKAHDWGDAPPGSGPMQVCRRCGEKQTSDTSRAECIGKPATGITETVHDYDPLAR